MIPIIYKGLVGKYVEICVVDPYNGRKYWYHGKLLASDMNGVKIDDFKNGTMVFDVSKILYVKEMNKKDIEKYTKNND